MLVELIIENYAVIERLRVRFHPGLNLLTGETGSGKSIVVGALDLLLLTAYTATYCVVLLAAAVALFRRKDLL